MCGTFSVAAVPRRVVFLYVSNSTAVAWISDRIKMTERLQKVE